MYKRKKLARESSRVTLQLFDDQLERMKEIFPNTPMSVVIRSLLDKMLRILEEGRSQAECKLDGDTNVK